MAVDGVRPDAVAATRVTSRPRLHQRETQSYFGTSAAALPLLKFSRSSAPP